MGNKLFICAIVMMIAGGIYASRITLRSTNKYLPWTTTPSRANP